MAQIIWTEPALSDLNEIAEYIAKDKVEAARRLVKQVFSNVDRLEQFPEACRIAPELENSSEFVVLCREDFDTPLEIIRSILKKLELTHIGSENQNLQHFFIILVISFSLIWRTFHRLRHPTTGEDFTP